MYSILEKNKLTYTVNEEILAEIRKKLASKGKKYSFSLNDLLNGYYSNELERFKQINKIFFEWIYKGDENNVDLIIKSIIFLNEIQKEVINFQKSYWDFINIVEAFNLQEFGNANDKWFLRALFKDIRVVFNFSYESETSEWYIMDDSIELFNNYFSNTLFRNYVIIFVDELLRISNSDKVKAFVLDLIANNRKIHTLLKPEQAAKSKNINNPKIKRDDEQKVFLYEKSSEEFIDDMKALWIKDYIDQLSLFSTSVYISPEKENWYRLEAIEKLKKEKEFSFDIIDMILRSLKKKIYARGASIFSNQLKIFSNKRQKFLKEKELNWDSTFIEHVSFVQNNQGWNQNGWDESVASYQNNDLFLFSTKKTSNFEEINKQINSIINILEQKEGYQKDIISLWMENNFSEELDEHSLNSQVISDNIYDILHTSFGSQKNKYIDFFNYVCKKHPTTMKRIYFYITKLIDTIFEIDKSLYKKNEYLFNSIWVKLDD